MSKSLMSFTLSRAAWRSSGNWYNGLRTLIPNRSFSGDSLKVVDQHDTQDNLITHIRSANSISNLLKIVHDNYRQMDEKHSVYALKTIFALQRDGRSEMSASKLISHPDFEKICRNIKRYSGVIQLSDAVDSLKALAYVDVSSKSTITQTLLQIVRGNINHLSISQIIFLDFLLKSFDQTPLVEALQIAIPMVFEINLPVKLNDHSPEQMGECFQYAVNKHLSMDTINFLQRKLEEYPGEFDANTAQRVVNVICSLPRDYSYEKLLRRVSTDLVVNIDDIAITKMEICLNRLAHKFSNKYPFYYQEVLFDTCANYIVDNNIGYKRAVGVARNMARLNHFHKRLLDYISNCVYANPNIEKDAADIYSITVFLILTDYRPVHWDHLKEWIRSCKNMAVENRKEIIWIRFAAALCVLDIYKIDVLNRALNESYISHLMEQKFRSNFENYFVIWQCIKTYKPDFEDLLPSNLDPQNINYIEKDDFPLQGALQTAFGGEEFVFTNLFSKTGIQIDHAMIFSNGAAVPFEIKSVKFVEDIKLDDSQQLVIIWAGMDYHYTLNTNMLRAIPAKRLDILEKSLKCALVPINIKNWRELLDEEKVPYLVQKIKEKVNLDIQSVEVENTV